MPVLNDQRMIPEAQGALVTISGTVPGAGAEIADTVPANIRWRLWAMEADLTTSGVAGLRTVLLIVDDAQSTISRRLILKDTTTQTISLTKTHHWSPGTEANDAASVAYTDGTTSILAKFPMSLQWGVLLPSGSNIRTITGAKDAGDQYSAMRYQVEQFIEVK